MTTQSTVLTSFPLLRQIYAHGTDLFSPADVGHVLGARIAEPQEPGVAIPDEFHRKAVAMGCQFLYQSDAFADGVPLTMKEIYARRENKDALGEKMLFKVDWYEPEPFYTAQTPRPGFCFKSRGSIPGTRGENCVQSLLILATFVERLFGSALSVAGREAITELRDKATMIEKLCKGNEWQEGAKQWAALAASKLFLSFPVEIICQVLLSQSINKERLFVGEYGRTRELSADGVVVGVGSAGAGGAYLVGSYPDDRDVDFGLPLSCSAELWAEG